MDVILDLDGTLCLPNGRDPFDWNEAINDLVNMPVHNVIVSMLRDRHRVIIVTGRAEADRKVTEHWLRQNTQFINRLREKRIYMRATDDKRPSNIVKAELLKLVKKDNYFPQLAFEDRAQDAKMYRDNGLTVAHVDVGDF